MKIEESKIKELIGIIGFKPQEGDKDIYYKTYKTHDNYILKVDFEQEKINYGTRIDLGDLTTSNFENSENFVVLECVDRVLRKGYAPDKLSLEHKWPMGRKEKGKLDILVMDNDNKAYLMIECKTWGDEYEKEKRKMQKDGGQLLSYFQQDKAAQYLCLYASRVIDGKIEFANEIVKVPEAWKELNNQKEIFDHWNKNFKDNGIFEEWANAYDIEIKSLTRGRLKELTEEDSGRIYNQFAEILRHNVVSDKPNAFNKIFNLFLCKIVDEDRQPNEELKFQWLETDNDEELLKRLSDLYKQGMKEYLTKEVTDYNDEQVEEKLYALDPLVRDQIREMFTRVRLHKNNEFAFKEVFDQKSFEENAVVVREVVELIQPYQIRYGHKQQFLGDFFELLLSTGIKQEAGQFFTPVPIAKFIISSLPLRELIQRKIINDEKHFLPYIIDYAAGSGHFLTESMDEVQNIINEIDEKKQRPSVKRNLSSWKINSFDWAYDYVYGIEADYRLVKTAKVSCFLNGDGLANVIHADGLDHFEKSIDYKGKLKEVSKENPKDNGKFDILIANPPYSVSAFKNTLKNGEESFNLFNRLTDDSSEIECLFIERTKQLLKPGGLAGIILPKSILNSSGIYMDAREIILKYFSIKAIAEFGSNTFMATGTNTVTLFLERRANNHWKKIKNSITKFFDKPKETKVNGIEKAFSKYVQDTFEDISFKDYISFINKNLSKELAENEIFLEYINWFNGQTEIKKLKTKKSFKDKAEASRKAELDKLFYEKVFIKEQEKMLYYFLTQPQETIVIKAGEKQAEKDFIGYEFSNRRGHEGIKMYRNKEGNLMTKLYDEDNYQSPEKCNSYIYSSFLSEKNEIASSLKNNLAYYNLTELLDFGKVNFEKAFSLEVQKKTKIKTKWPLKRIENILTKVKGSTTKISKSEILIKGKHPVITQDSNKIISGYSNNDKPITDLPIIVFGDHNCTFKYLDYKFIRGADGTQLIKTNDEFISKYFFYVLHILEIPNKNKYERHFKYLKDIYVPIPPKKTQEKIISEIENLEKKENKFNIKLTELNSSLNNIFSELSHPISKLGKVASFKNGLNYSEKSKGDSVTIIGVKDFLEDFTPNLDKLIDVQIDGVLPEDYKLKEGDILVVRSNGSANLVGRFIYIDKLTDTTSYSGFTIRIRVNSESINSKYLCYCLRTETVRNKITKDPKGANIKSVNQSMLSAIDIPLPPIETQQEIVKNAEVLEKKIIKTENEIRRINQQKEETLWKHLN